LETGTGMVIVPHAWLWVHMPVAAGTRAILNKILTVKMLKQAGR
jgi:hypothetical protein